MRSLGQPEAILTLIALAIGIATSVFAVAFQKSLSELMGNRATYGYAQDVEVYRYPAYSDSDLTTLLAAQPETSSRGCYPLPARRCPRSHTRNPSSA